MAHSADSDKDFILDLKTSTLIPKYLGKIKAMHGKVIIGDRELKVGSKIYNEDLVQTKEKSFALLDMVDLTTITLGPETDFKVEGWSFKTKNDRDAQFNVMKGQWRARVRSKAKELNQLKIKTPVVSMGIRGTELMVNVLKKNGKDVTQVALLSGEIHVEGGTPDMTQDLVPGDHAVIIKSEKGIEHKDRKISEEERKHYQEFVMPEIPELLEPIKIEDSTLEAKNTVTSDQKKTQSSVVVPDSTGKTKTVQENLEILNSVRQENLKK